MARDHDKENKPKAPEILEREINLTLINAKQNQILNLLSAVAEKAGVETEED